MEHNPFIMALSKGSFVAKAGSTSGLGNIFLFSINTNKKTIVEIIITRRKTAFSFFNNLSNIVLLNKFLFYFWFFSAYSSLSTFISSNNLFKSTSSVPSYMPRILLSLSIKKSWSLPVGLSLL